MASCAPSGDHDGNAEPPGSLVICLAPVPSEFAVKICWTLLTVRVKAILPSNFAAGVTAFDGADNAPAPALFTARTVNV